MAGEIDPEFAHHLDGQLGCWLAVAGLHAHRLDGETEFGKPDFGDLQLLGDALAGPSFGHRAAASIAGTCESQAQAGGSAELFDANQALAKNLEVTVTDLQDAGGFCESGWSTVEEEL
jgi:hypothetical protein